MGDSKQRQNLALQAGEWFAEERTAAVPDTRTSDPAARPDNADWAGPRPSPSPYKLILEKTPALFEHDAADSRWWQAQLQRLMDSAADFGVR